MIFGHDSMYHKKCDSGRLRLPGGGSITVFLTLFNKAVLLSYAFTFGPYSFTIEISTGSTIIKRQ